MWTKKDEAAIRRRKYMVLTMLLAAIFTVLPGNSIQAAEKISSLILASGTTPGTGQGTTPGTGQGTNQGTTPGTGQGTNSGTTSGTGESTNSGLISTQLSSQGRTVTLTVNISQNSQVSSGRLKIHYDSDMLRLSGTQAGSLWGIEDVNTGLTEAGQNVIAFAWADTQKLVQGGRILTVTWEAQDKANGQEIIVETEIEEMFSQEEPVAITSGLRIDRLRTSFEVSQPGATTTANTNNTSVRTGDDANPIVYLLLCICAVAVMAALVCRRVKKR